MPSFLILLLPGHGVCDCGYRLSLVVMGDFLPVFY